MQFWCLVSIFLCECCFLSHIFVCTYMSWSCSEMGVLRVAVMFTAAFVFYDSPTSCFKKRDLGQSSVSNYLGVVVGSFYVTLMIEKCFIAFCCRWRALVIYIFCSKHCIVRVWLYCLLWTGRSQYHSRQIVHHVLLLLYVYYVTASSSDCFLSVLFPYRFCWFSIKSLCIDELILTIMPT